jgi:ethanolamine-phosphate phospho-lyase
MQVVEAQCTQLQLLNTNARYLSTIYSKYSTKLLATLPACLERFIVCNSGSEANDLALQIARSAHPKAQHVAVMEGAYHGHVSCMMQCSPYKFWGPNGGGRPEHVHVLPFPDSYRHAPPF